MINRISWELEDGCRFSNLKKEKNRPMKTKGKVKIKENLKQNENQNKRQK